MFFVLSSNMSMEALFLGVRCIGVFSIVVWVLCSDLQTSETLLSAFTIDEVDKHGGSLDMTA